MPYEGSRLSHGHKELCFTLLVLLMSDDPSSGKPCFFIFSNIQMRIPSPYSSFLLQRQFSTLVLKSRLVHLKCWTKQWRGLTVIWPWTLVLGENHRLYQCSTGTFRAGSDARRKPHQGRRQWAEGQTAPFPPFMLAQVLPDPDTSQKGVTNSETNSNSGYFLHLFKQPQCWIYFPQKDSRLSRTGWFLHQRTKNRFGPSQTTQITSKGRGRLHPGLAI